MEWSKDKTLKLIELLQVNATFWNPSLCDTRRDKQKRKEELRVIADILNISIHDITKKIQHLRTQYNRESAKEARANAEDPNERYISNWYAYEYLHFMKDSSKPFRIFQSEEPSEVNNSLPNNSDNSDCKLSPLHKISRLEPMHALKSEIVYPMSPRDRDEFSVFGEYIANELRSLRGEKNLLVAKKKIQDAIFEVKMGLIGEPKNEITPTFTVLTHSNQPHNSTSTPSSKLYTSPSTSTHMDSLSSSHPTPTSGISEIIINNACHYSNFKVDTQ